MFPVQFQTGNHTDKREKRRFEVENQPENVLEFNTKGKINSKNNIKYNKQRRSTTPKY